MNNERLIAQDIAMAACVRSAAILHAAATIEGTMASSFRRRFTGRRAAAVPEALRLLGRQVSKADLLEALWEEAGDHQTDVAPSLRERDLAKSTLEAIVVRLQKGRARSGRRPLAQPLLDRVRGALGRATRSRSASKELG